MTLAVVHDMEGILQHLMDGAGEDPYWQSLVQHCRFLCLMLRPSYATAEFPYLQDMLRCVHVSICQCWPSLLTMHKFHFFLKTVSEAKRKAPTRIAWCMMFEHFHQKIKNKLPITNTKDICGSIMGMAAWQLAFMVPMDSLTAF